MSGFEVIEKLPKSLPWSQEAKKARSELGLTLLEGLKLRLFQME